jgi:hypothetical protein
MFEVGQKIVCVKTHSQDVVKEGEVYPLKNIHFSPCCNHLLLDVGIKIGFGAKLRCDCGLLYNSKTNILWLGAVLFRPLDDMYNEEIEELTEVLSEPVTFSL